MSRLVNDWLSMFSQSLPAAALRWFVTILVIASVAFVPSSARSTDDEYAQKATYLHNFVLFTQWPDSSFESPSSPLILGVIGDDPFGRKLDNAVASTRRGKRPIVVRRYRTVFHLEDCHALFISDSERDQVDAILDRTLERAVLVVSDMEGVADRGGVINFFESKNRLQFEIQLGTAQLFGLRVDPRLLRLGRVRRPLPEPLVKRLKERAE